MSDDTETKVRAYLKKKYINSIEYFGETNHSEDSFHIQHP